MLVFLCLSATGLSQTQQDDQTPDIEYDAFADTASPIYAPLRIEDLEVVRGAAIAMRGDFLRVNPGNGGGARFVQLRGISAPRKDQLCRTKRGGTYDCFEFSKVLLDRLVKGREVLCILEGASLAAAYVGQCQADNIDLSGAMVAAGWAMARPSLSGSYRSIQSRAQARHRGMWAGRIEAPHDFHKRSLPSRMVLDPLPPARTEDIGG